MVYWDAGRVSKKKFKSNFLKVYLYIFFILPSESIIQILKIKYMVKKC